MQKTVVEIIMKFNCKRLFVDKRGFEYNLTLLFYKNNK